MKPLVLVLGPILNQGILVPNHTAPNLLPNPGHPTLQQQRLHILPILSPHHTARRIQPLLLLQININLPPNKLFSSKLPALVGTWVVADGTVDEVELDAGCLVGF